MSPERRHASRSPHHPPRRPAGPRRRCATTGASEWDAELASLADVPPRYRRPIRRAARRLCRRVLAAAAEHRRLRLDRRRAARRAAAAAARRLRAHRRRHPRRWAWRRRSRCSASPTRSCSGRCPTRSPDRIVTLWETRDASTTSRSTSRPGNFLDWRERARSFEYLAGVEPWSHRLRRRRPRPEVWSSRPR